jgi:hypothetical protein
VSERDRNLAVFGAGTVYALGTAVFSELNPDLPLWQVLLAVPGIVVLLVTVIFMLEVLA